MPIPVDKPILTRLYDGWRTFRLAPGSTYIHGTSVEERSVHPEAWEDAATEVTFVRLISLDVTRPPDFFRCIAEINDVKKTLHLRSGAQLEKFFLKINSETTYLDITGLSHHVWAPLLKAAVSLQKALTLVYVEPRSYTFSPTPTKAEIFDLSEAIHGILPLPGFGMLSEPLNEESVIFVPFLGFEGRRFAYLLEHVQPPIHNVFPIVGVPGFMPEFPFHTYAGNRNILEETNLHTQMYSGIANSAPDAFYLLQKISSDYPQHLIKIAPIGTKPHALGAVLFALWTNRPVEIIYDHPIRKANRTFGSANILVYDVSELLSPPAS